MPESQNDANAAPAVADRAEPAPGKMRVEQKTLDQFDDGQRGALQQANMERTTRGLPQWLIADYVRVHPDKFPDVDYELDHAEHADRVRAAAVPPDNARIDQRPVR